MELGHQLLAAVRELTLELRHANDLRQMYGVPIPPPVQPPTWKEPH